MSDVSLQSMRGDWILKLHEALRAVTKEKERGEVWERGNADLKLHCCCSAADASLTKARPLGRAGQPCKMATY